MNDETSQAVNPVRTAQRWTRSWWFFVVVMLTPPVLMGLVARADDALVGVVVGAGGASALFCGFWLARRVYDGEWWGIQVFMTVVFAVLLLLVSIVLCCIGFMLGGGDTSFRPCAACG